MKFKCTIECKKCGYKNFIFPFEPEDLHHCPECGSKDVKVFDSTEIKDEDKRVH